MAIYWNMNRSMLRNGGRKAPEMTVSQLEALLDAALPHRERSCDDFEIRMFEAVDQVIEEEPSSFTKVLADFQKIEVDFENFEFQEFAMGTNGVPFASVIFGGDWEWPVIGFVYWDGQNFRGYLPTYGNDFNAKSKGAFGSEHYHPGPYTYLQDGVLKTVRFSSENEYHQFFENLEGIEVRVNVDACIEDFSTRVVNTGKLSNMDFQKALVKFKNKNQDEEEKY